MSPPGPQLLEIFLVAKTKKTCPFLGKVVLFPVTGAQWRFTVKERARERERARESERERERERVTGCLSTTVAPAAAAAAAARWVSVAVNHSRVRGESTQLLPLISDPSAEPSLRWSTEVRWCASFLSSLSLFFSLSLSLVSEMLLGVTVNRRIRARSSIRSWCGRAGAGIHAPSRFVVKLDHVKVQPDIIWLLVFGLLSASNPPHNVKWCFSLQNSRGV